MRSKPPRRSHGAHHLAPCTGFPIGEISNSSASRVESLTIRAGRYRVASCVAVIASAASWAEE